MSGVGRLWLIGGGNMGGALARHWRLAGFDPIVIDPAHGTAIPSEGAPDVLVLAVKPQIWVKATEGLGGRIGAATLVVSVMAGVTLAALAARFPDARLARTMPNTPAARGRGITGLYMDSSDPASCARLENLFSPAGATAWLDAEAEFDAVTAVSGSGPAYFFAMVEALAAGGAAAGLAPDLAARLARATLTGAAALLEDGEDPAALRAAVTSAGGTTAAGLAVLMPALGPLLRDTVAAARDRSRDLGRIG